MQIYQPFITDICATVAKTTVDTFRDFEIAALIAVHAQTIVFSADQALALRPALERFDETVEYRLPFPQVILQFDRPLPEHEFFSIEHAYQSDPAHLQMIDRLWHEHGQSVHGWTPADGDALVALLLAQDDIDGVLHNQAVAFFASTALNRVHWHGDNLGWLPNSDRTFADNKRALRNLCVACVAYLNCINLTLERQEAPNKVQKRRAKDGKPPLLAYYTVVVAPAYRHKDDGESTGMQHGHRYDVRGHLRKLPGNRLIWVRPHQRGLAHELYIPSVRVVE